MHICIETYTYIHTKSDNLFARVIAIVHRLDNENIVHLICTHQKTRFNTQKNLIHSAKETNSFGVHSKTLTCSISAVGRLANRNIIRLVCTQTKACNTQKRPIHLAFGLHTQKKPFNTQKQPIYLGNEPYSFGFYYTE